MSYITSGAVMKNGGATLEYLTSGQMAKLCCVSEKALRVYHKKKILVPAYINDETGYRYYRVEQCSTVDMVMQLRAIGLSLDEIQHLTKLQDIRIFESKVSERLATIEKQQSELAIAKQTAEDFLGSCAAFFNKPICDQILLEQLPDRHILLFDLPTEDMDQYTVEYQWEKMRQSTKEQIVLKNYPISLYRNTGGAIIPKENILKRSFEFEKIFVFVNNDFGESFCEASILPGGQHLTIYTEHCVDYGNANYKLEEEFILRMLDYAEAKNFEVSGDYYDENIADTPAFGYRGRDAFFKLCLPVRKKS